VGSCHDGLPSAEDCEQANKASPASWIFTAATKSALAVKPHWTQLNFSCVLRFSAETLPHAGHLRLVFCGGTANSKPAPPRQFVLQLTPQFEWARVEHGTIQACLQLDVFAVLFLAALADFDIFLMHKSSMNMTAWFLLRSFDDLCMKSFLMLAIWLCNFETLKLGLLPVLRERLLAAENTLQLRQFLGELLER